jgi:hypothetical protein
MGLVALSATFVLSRGRAQDASPDVTAAIEELGSRDDAAAARGAETLRNAGVGAEPALLSALDGATGAKKDRIEDLLRYLGHVTDDELLGLERKVIAAIRGAGDKGSLEAAVRREVEAFATDHAPPVTRTHASSDGTIVIAIGHGGKAGEDGTDAAASDARATLVIAIGGYAGAAQGGVVPRAGSARSDAANGIAIAIGGRGAWGGGPGGDATAASAGGVVAVGGEGGQGTGTARQGSPGASSGTQDPRALKDRLR